MKSALLLVACLSLPLTLGFSAPPAAAKTDNPAAVDDVSAAKRGKAKGNAKGHVHRHRTSRVVRYGHPMVPRQARAPFYATGADPSFDRYGRPYRPPSYLSCPVDLGYGRWGDCNMDW